jgi:archaetidylinositol phosphate synthase
MAAERRCLLWLARRLPQSITSDHLTVLALAAMAGAGACYWAARFHRAWLAGVVLCLAANWFGDSLDGTVARVRQQQRPRYGFYVDHIVDTFGVLLIVGGLACSGFMNPLVALPLLVAYFMLAIDIYLAAYSRRVFNLSFAGMGPTELRLLLAVGTLALWRDPRVELFGGRFRLFDVGGTIATVCIGFTLLLSVAGNVRALYLAEPVPRRDKEAGPAPAASPRTAIAVGRRWLFFTIVGAMGFALQLGLIWSLTSIGRIHYVAATLIAVEAAVLHNFLWHSSWTWADRAVSRQATLERLLRYNLTTGMISIAGNVAVTIALVHHLRISYLTANVIAIAVCSSANFLLSHRIIFVPAIALLMVLSLSATARGADLSPAWSAAFDREAQLVAARLDDERAGRTAFLWIDGLTESERRASYARLTRGDVITEKLPLSSQASSLRGALLHHWMATTLVAGVPLVSVVRLMQSYNSYCELYRPQVTRSHLLARDGNTFDVALQLYTKKVVSVTLNTESTATYLPVDAAHMQVRSLSTRIAEVRQAGGASESEAPIGHDSGFLWRFNNYCALEQRAEGTYVQCETLSLTRDLPFGFGWLIEPFVTSVPRESIERTLVALRASLQGGSK